LRNHPLFIPFAGAVEVRWLRHSDDVCHAEEYARQADCKGRLAALAKQVAVKGIVGRVPENGHWLKGKYHDIMELKPSGHRFFGFRDGRVFYLASGVKKDPRGRVQKRDYEFALGLRIAYFERKS
jgi:hypothetical protein